MSSSPKIIIEVLCGYHGISRRRRPTGLADVAERSRRQEEAHTWSRRPTRGHQEVGEVGGGLCKGRGGGREGAEGLRGPAGGMGVSR